MPQGNDFVVNSAVLHDEEFARRAAIRQAARLATMEMKDDRAMREALDARPRVRQSFRAGDLVAFWRRGKGSGRKSKARWRGLARVVGKLKENYIVAFGGQWLLTAPWQLRPGSREEIVASQIDEELLTPQDIA